MLVILHLVSIPVHQCLYRAHLVSIPVHKCLYWAAADHALVILHLVSIPVHKCLYRAAADHALVILHLVSIPVHQCLYWAAADHVLVILHLVSIPVHSHNTCPTLSHFTSFLCHRVTLICVYHNAFMFTVAIGALPQIVGRQSNSRKDSQIA